MNARPSFTKPDRDSFIQYFKSVLLGRRQVNLCFHFAGSGDNLPDITKSRDGSLDNDLLALSSRS